MKINNQTIPTQLKTLAGAIALASFAFTPATQATSINANASVTVQGTLNVTKVSDLDMGTIVVKGDPADTSHATLVVPANPATLPSATNNDGSIVIINPGSPAEFEITGAAPNTAITITTPAAALVLEDPSVPTGTGRTLSLDTWTTYPTVSAAPFTNETDATGTLAFNVGATMTTTSTNDSTTDGLYPDGTYTGSFTIEVNY